MTDHNEVILQEVEVDQGALVNILSRYPGTFDVLRELIQNADDAEAPIVEVHFETGEVEKFQPTEEFTDISELSIRRWIIKNKGSFREKDWERLGRIAAGNDNSTKVGAFGVGFYSVLSKSDRPLVRSNGKSLQFCRREDGKLCKQSTHCSKDEWTSVELDLKLPEALPDLADLARFLVSSLAFLTNIDTVSVLLDGQRLLHIQKESRESPADIPIPPHLLQTSPGPLETLTVESIQRTVQTITIDAAEWAFTSSSTSSAPLPDTADTLIERSAPSVEDLASSAEAILHENSIIHDLYTATVCVNLLPDSEMKKGVELIMKSLPSSFKCKGIYFNSEQYDSLDRLHNSHLRKAKHLACLFISPQGLVPGNSGRLFIGQSTNQTTGIGLHISAHFLPTMERGSIDLANGQVAAWNNEVLWVGGFLARVIYEEEMRIAAGFKDEFATKLGLRTMARFAFGSTSPHSGVSQMLQDAFFSCCHKSKPPFPVVSDTGISCASHSQFRQSNKDLSFLRRYRILHEDIEPRQLSQIIERYEIPTFKYKDIVYEFETGVTQDTMKAFFVWWEDTRKRSLLSKASEAAGKQFCEKFASQGVLHSNRGIIPLKNVKHFTFFSLPDDLCPPDNIYIDIDVPSGVPTKDAVECFGWTQLLLLQWLEYACAQARRLASNKDPELGHRISRLLVRFALVEELTLSEWNQVADLMEDIECIPTNIGLRFPTDSYFDEADICRNLPVAKEDGFMDIPGVSVAIAGGFRSKTVTSEHIRHVLAALRVRPMMEWRDMIEGLETAASEESNDRLLQFLFSHREMLADQYTGDLKRRRVFYSENHGRVSATELHFPNEDIRRLGLPILALPRNGVISSHINPIIPSSASAVGPFIESIGIQRYPSLDKIIGLAASREPEIQRSALQYLLLNLEARYDAYKPEDFAEIAFIPTKSGSLSRPNEVLASPIWEKLGFKQASETLRSRDLSKLGIKDDPSVDTIIKYLKTPQCTLPDIDTAKLWFDHLSQYGNLPILKLREQFSKIPFVPVKGPKLLSSEPSSIEYIPPKDCFIALSSTKEHYRNIFPFVDFGQNGNSFLESCCAKKLPDAADIVRKIVMDPQRYLTALGNDTRLYNEDLATIALQFDSIPEDDKDTMRCAPMFLASQQHVDGSKLLPAHKVVIKDWESRDFGSYVFSAPENDVTEKLYRKMGSEFLGTYVQYDIVPSGPSDKHKLLLDRGQVIRRIRCFMRQRDKSEKTDLSFYQETSTDDFRVRACKTLTMKKTFAPPHGVLADGVDARMIATQAVRVKAGFESGESTLWVVEGSSESVDMRNDIAVALCRVLLKSFGPNDVLLLSSLIAMDDKRLEGYYGSEKKSELTIAPAAKESKRKPKVEFMVPIHLARLVGIHPKILGSYGRKTISPDDDIKNAIASLCGPDSDDQPPDFTAPCQPHPAKFKKHSSHCKEARKIKLVEKKSLQDERTQIKFFLAQNARCQQPPQAALQEFAKLISELGHVFGPEVAKACYIFWKDTDEDLMAFNRDQKYIFFNLAHYHKFFYPRDAKDVEKEKKVITEWFLIMAHEIAHNVTLDHDEYHGSLSSRFAITYLPTLHRHFKCFTGDA